MRAPAALLALSLIPWLVGCPAEEPPAAPPFEAPAPGTIHVRASERVPARLPRSLGAAIELCPAEAVQLEAWITDRGREWRRMAPVVVGAGEVVQVVFELDEAHAEAAVEAGEVAKAVFELDEARPRAALYAVRDGSASFAFEPIPDTALPATKDENGFASVGFSSPTCKVEPASGGSCVASTWILGPGAAFTHDGVRVTSLEVEGKAVSPAQAPFPVWELHLGWAPADAAGAEAGQAETR